MLQDLVSAHFWCHSLVYYIQSLWSSFCFSNPIIFLSLTFWKCLFRSEHSFLDLQIEIPFHPLGVRFHFLIKYFLVILAKTETSVSLQYSSVFNLFVAIIGISNLSWIYFFTFIVGGLSLLRMRIVFPGSLAMFGTLCAQQTNVDRLNGVNIRIGDWWLLATWIRDLSLVCSDFPVCNFCMTKSVSLFLLCKQVHLYHFFKGFCI